MPISALSRREFSVALAVAAFAAALPEPVRAASSDLVYIGMHGNQITLARFDPAAGNLTLSTPVADMPSPTWIVVHPKLPVIYSDSELGNDGKSDGSVFAFRVDRATGALTKIGQIDAGGGGTTFLFLDAPSMTLLATNYGSGSVSTIPLSADGGVGAVVSVIKDVGSGPNPRQQGPHAHSVVVDPSGRFALVADLGADRVFVYPFDRATHALNPDPPGQERHFACTPGSGPRHVGFHSNGHTAYVFCELTAELQVLAWDATAGKLTLSQTLSTNSADFKGKSAAAELAVSRDGRFVYVSNRGEFSLVVYSANRDTGALTFLQRVASGGDPWSFGLHPSGRWLLVAAQDVDKVNVFAVDPSSGRLTDTGRSIATPTPVCVSFVS
jgi:6-phosphogluconolactonase